MPSLSSRRAGIGPATWVGRGVVLGPIPARCACRRPEPGSRLGRRPTPAGGLALTPVRTTSSLRVRGIGDRGGAAAGRRSACRSTTRSRLICAGWLPQDRVFGSELSAWSRNERRRSSTLSAAHSLGGVLLLALRPYVRR